MEIKKFIENYREAFGEYAELPIVFWYSDILENETVKVNGCFFKSMSNTGFTDMPEHVPTFVSLKERYKQTPEMVKSFIEQLGVPRAEKEYLHFARIDKVETFDHLEGILFLVNPDILSGLTTWAFFDNNKEDTVISTFGSGCSSVVTQTILENRKGGYRTFIGFFDPSVRPYFEADILSYTIPMSRFKVMYETMRSSCLFDTHAWGKIRERNHNSYKE